MTDNRTLRMVAWIGLVLGGGAAAWFAYNTWPGIAAYVIAGVVLVVLVLGNLPRLRKR